MLKSAAHAHTVLNKLKVKENSTFCLQYHSDISILLNKFVSLAKNAHYLDCPHLSMWEIN